MKTYANEVNAAQIEKTAEIFPVNLLTFSSHKPFDQVILDFEKQLGRLDHARALASSADLPESIKSMEGGSGLMIIAILEMDRLLPSLISSPTRARQYLVGNPLIASKMTQVNTLASLFAPPRVLIYTGDDQTWISYDQPSTVFGRLPSELILQTAAGLDQKFEELALKALGPILP